MQNYFFKINGNNVDAEQFAFDGCHKIYLLEDEDDVQDALNYGYKVLDIDELVDTWAITCPLRFIENWKLTKTYVPQCEIATFEYVDKFD